jgi:hypothetical protein
MKNIENSEAENYQYTVIDYNDGIDDQSIVFDFHCSANDVLEKICEKKAAGKNYKICPNSNGECKNLIQSPYCTNCGAKL